MPKQRNVLIRLWDVLTGPSASLKEIGDQRSARLAASFLLVILLLDVIGGIARAGRLGWAAAFTGGLGFSAASTLVAYPWTRTKWYRGAVFIFSISFAATAYLSIMAAGSAADHGAIILIYVPLSLIVASSFLSPWMVFLLTGLNIGTYLALPLLGGTLPGNIYAQVGIIALIGSVLILLANFHTRLENARLKDVQKINLELQALSDQLEQENAELERFAYTVSHDLKSPIITIKGFLGFLRRDVRTNNSSRMESDIQRISEATDKMDRLLKELLELSRVGRVVNPPKEISFRDLVADALDMVQGRIMERGIEVHVQEQLPVIHGDYQRLAEVLQNLLDNAAKYMGDQTSPRVEVGSMIVGQENVFFVRDNGMGIEPQYQTRIFGLFEKLDPSSEGTGIGLALVKRIVEVHGGRVWAESKGLGHGSTFCFTVPAGTSSG